MNQSIFAPYAQIINNVLEKAPRRGIFEKGFTTDTPLPVHTPVNGVLAPLSTLEDRSLFNSLSIIGSPFADPSYNKSSTALGSHPDFTHLRNDPSKIEKHYITTVFIDIKNSTRLFDLYEPEFVAAITTAVQRLALHICWYFGGYVHRLQGDGLMVYFGGKHVKKEVSIQQALHAASFFTYFIKNDLPNVLDQLPIEKRLFTRIGIDFGDDRDVVWHLAGIGSCSEITTCSLHTSLAPKMQSKAESNGVVVGDNVKNLAPKEAAYFSIIKKQDGSEDRYIFRGADNFLYTQWKFDWFSFLKNHPELEVDAQGNLRYKSLQPTARPTQEQTAHLLPKVQGYQPYYNG